MNAWAGCYDSSLKGMIQPESFAHPAKMARALCERILDHGREMGYWQPGDTLLDPFAGIFTTGILGAYRGYRVVGIELEPRFVEMARANVEYNRRRLEALGRTLPVILQGDSRNLGQLVGQAGGVVTSPPYIGSINANDQANDAEARISRKAQAGIDVSVSRNIGGPNSTLRAPQTYGHTDGQLGAMPAGDFRGVVTSPPFGEQQTGGGLAKPDARYLDGTRIGSNCGYQNQADSAANLASLQYGDFGAVRGAVTSPPWESSLSDGLSAEDRIRYAPLRRSAQSVGIDYGTTPGQLGQQSGDTYWTACATIYAQLFAVLQPGGAAAIVVKDFVRNKQRVPLCDQTAELLEAVGFTVVERVQAMLVKEHGTMTDMFTAETVTRRTERKSFFRRLAERKGSPAIDYEEVIWAVRPR